MTPELEKAWRDVERAIDNCPYRSIRKMIVDSIRDDDVAEALRHYIRLEDIENGEQE